MNRLERSLFLLQRVNEGRLSCGKDRSNENLKRAEKDLALHDVECRKGGQMSLLDHEQRSVPEKPRACEDCGARVPADLATVVGEKVAWLCARCRDGRLPEDERRSLEAHARAKSNGGGS